MLSRRSRSSGSMFSPSPSSSNFKPTTSNDVFTAATEMRFIAALVFAAVATAGPAGHGVGVLEDCTYTAACIDGIAATPSQTVSCCTEENGTPAVS